MTTSNPNIASLNNITFDATDSSVTLSIDDGLTDTAGSYVASQNTSGDLATFDQWDGNTAGPGSTPQPTDIVSYHTTVEPVVPTNAPFGVIVYTFTQENGHVNPVSGGTGAEVVAWNSTGVLLEQLTAYVPGQTTVTPDGSYFILAASSVDLSSYDGSSGPTAAELTFTTSGPFPALTQSSTQCFAAGTGIACASGRIAVEDLRVGDRVVLAEGGLLPIAWIGWRSIDLRRHPDPDAVLPFRIAPDAFGESSPSRPLFLSPDHAVFVDGVLIPIRLLANGSTIRQVERETVIYYHIELRRHAVLLADGLPAESFLDNGNRAWFQNAIHSTSRERDCIASVWECLACAPLILTGPRLDAARRYLSARTGLSVAAVTLGESVRDPAVCHMEFAKP
jgi:hypothetical protein